MVKGNGQMPNTVQQLYKVMSSQHRDMRTKHRALQCEIDNAQELTADTSRYVRNDVENARNLICRRINLAFGARAVSILISGWMDRRDRVNFENSVKLAVERRDILIPPTATQDAYLLNLTDFGSCKAYTVSRIVYYSANGIPVIERNDVMFTLPGMPECKPQ